MSHNPDNTEKAVPDLPTNNDGIDTEAVIKTIRLDKHPVFRIGACVYQYRGIHLGGIVVDRLSGAAKTQTGRLPLSDVWYDYHNDDLELGEWSCNFVSSDMPDGSNEPPAMNSGSEEPTVEISVSTALTARQEIELLIKETGGSDSATKACTPLALTRQKVERSDQLSENARNHVLDLLRAVAEERGVELSDADPLVDGTFQAKQELERALESDSS